MLQTRQIELRGDVLCRAHVAWQREMESQEIKGEDRKLFEMMFQIRIVEDLTFIKFEYYRNIDLKKPTFFGLRKMGWYLSQENTVIEKGYEPS